MKVALVIAGMYREFDHCYPTWTFMPYLDVDIYFSTWDRSVEKNEKLNIDIDEPVTIERIQQHVQPFNYCIEQYRDRQQDQNSKNMTNRWAQGIDLVLGSQISYDRIVIIRPDSFMDIDDAAFVTALNEIIPGHFYTPGGVMQHVNGETGIKGNAINDFVIAGDYETMKQLASIGNDARAHGYIFDIHVWIYKWMTSHGAVCDLAGLRRYCIRRSLSRNRVNQDWDMINADTGLWWENHFGVRY